MAYNEYHVRTAESVGTRHAHNYTLYLFGH